MRRIAIVIILTWCSEAFAQHPGRSLLGIPQDVSTGPTAGTGTGNGTGSITRAGEAIGIDLATISRIGDPMSKTFPPPATGTLLGNGSGFSDARNRNDEDHGLWWGLRHYGVIAVASHLLRLWDIGDFPYRE